MPDARLPNGVVTKVRNAVRGAINKQVNKGHRSRKVQPGGPINKQVNKGHKSQSAASGVILNNIKTILNNIKTNK